MTLQATSVRTLSSALLLVALSCTVVVAVVESDAPHLNEGDPVKYKDCGQLLKAGYNVSGVHQLWMNASASFLIRCEFHKGNAFTVIQRRLDSTISFEQTLSLYISGFGNAQSNYWAGLNTINYLTTAQGNNVLTVHLQDWAGSSVALTYKKFTVLPQDNRYQMQISGYVGPAGLDDLSYHNGATFQTYDYPDPNNCAVYMRAGWWYNYCAYALLNGRYYNGGSYPTPASGYNDGIYWRDWRGYNYSMKFVSMVVSNS